MKKSRNELPTRIEAGGVCFQGQDWGGINVARVRFLIAPLIQRLMHGVK